MPVKPPAAPPPAALEEEFATTTATIRGVKWVLRELDATTYEELLQKATGENRVVDQSLMFRLMLDKSVIEPEGMTVKAIYAKPYSVVRKLEQIVNDLHFTEVLSDEEKDEEDEIEKGEALG